MARLPRISGQKLIATLAKAGFVVTRIRGSHHFLEHEDGRGVLATAHMIGSEIPRPYTRETTSLYREAQMDTRAARNQNEVAALTVLIQLPRKTWILDACREYLATLLADLLASPLASRRC